MWPAMNYAEKKTHANAEVFQLSSEKCQMKRKSLLKAQGACTASQPQKEQFQWGCDKRLREYRQVSAVSQAAVSVG